jgi:uncharacterized membrane protein (UPF0127 family)
VPEVKFQHLLLVVAMMTTLIVATVISGKLPIATPLRDGTHVNVRVPGTSVCATVASNAESRMLGLTATRSLAPLHGMLYVYDDQPGRPQFWGKNMSYDTELWWIDVNQVVSVTQNPHADPGTAEGSIPRHAPPRTIDRVLEVPAGTAAARNVSDGQQIVMTQVAC